MDSKTVKKAAESNLLNGVKDPRIGAYELAVWAHADTCSTSMFPWVNGKDSSWEEVFFALDFSPVDQDALVVSHRHNSEEDFLIMLFPKDDMAVVAARQEGEEEVDPVCRMTIAKFFEYLNTIPNIHAFANLQSATITGRSVVNREAGLYLLKSLCVPGPAYPGSE